MNKNFALASALAVIAASWAGTTWYSSQHIEGHYQQTIERFNRHTLSPVTLKLTSFKRGFLHSRANWEVNLTLDPCQPNNSMVLTGYDEITHGFIPSLGWASIHSHIIWPDVVETPLKQVFASKEPLSIRSRVNFLGNLRTHISSPAFNWQNELMQVNWKGLQGSINFSENNEQLSFKVQVPGLTVQAKNSNTQQLVLSDLRYQGSQRVEQSLLPLGKTEFLIKNIQVGSQNNLWRFKNVLLGSKNQLNRGMLSANMNYQIDNIDFNQQSVGNFQANVVLEHLSEQAVQEAYQRIGLLQRQCNPPTQAILQAFAPIFKQGFQLRLNQAELQLFKGSAQANALVLLPAMSQPEQQSVEQILNQMSASGRLQVSEQLIKGVFEHISQQKGEAMSPAEAEQMLRMITQNMLEQGYLTKTATGYQLSFALNQGQASVNGQPLHRESLGSSAFNPERQGQ
ncbi:YdgA family protein [Alkanindiges sp. WGS2144]|uniref:YdgA family protein n=1 Tax=Alkanindiges sp. WGS2144 TaxID=3366808 RepID=UPI0037508465